MIIFDLDGSLANCEHRRHFVDPEAEYQLLPEHYKTGFNVNWFKENALTKDKYGAFKNKEIKIWKPNWKAFFEACDKDTPIEPVIAQWNTQIGMGFMGEHQIWSGRCESVREKTEKWLDENLLGFLSHQLKMRPIGDNTPDEILKMQWLDEALESGETIDYVFDDRPKVVKAWRDRGIFVFDCNQTGKIF